MSLSFFFVLAHTHTQLTTMTLCTDHHPATNTFQGRVCWKGDTEGVEVSGRGTCQWWPLTHQVDSTFKFHTKPGCIGWDDQIETEEEFKARMEEEAPYRKQTVIRHVLGVTMDWGGKARLEIRLEEKDFPVFLQTVRHEQHTRSIPIERLKYQGHALQHPLRVRLCHLDATLVVESIVPSLPPDLILMRKKLKSNEIQQDEELEREEGLWAAQSLTHVRYQLPSHVFHGVCAAAYQKVNLCAHLPPLVDPGGALQLMRDQRLIKERRRQAEIGLGLIPPPTSPIAVQEDRAIARHCVLLDHGIGDRILNTKTV